VVAPFFIITVALFWVDKHNRAVHPLATFRTYLGQP
jgi:hypothetical protein